MFDNKNNIFLFVGFFLFVTLLIVAGIYLWPCQKNRKIDKLTLFVSDIQSDYSNISKEEWVFYDASLDEFIKNIESCSSELTEQDRDYIEKQKSIYGKVKIKWKIEKVFDFNDND
jgi:hypothetical protein